VKALRLHGIGDLRLHSEPPPVPVGAEILVRVAAVGLCGSDRHWLAEGGIGDALLGRPLVLGHELTGTIVSGPRSGERVAVDPAAPCGRCEQCRDGLGHLCRELRFLGHGVVDGGLQELLVWPDELLHRLPSSIGDPEGSLLEPLGVALHAVDLGHVRDGTRAAVFGCGPIGLLLVRALRAVGAEVGVAEVLEHRLEVALADGAAILEGEVDVAFEAAGDDGALDAAIAATRPGGRVVIVGIPDGDRTSFSAAAARRKGLTLLVSRRMTATDLPRAIGLVDSGRISLGGLISEVHDLEHGAEAFAGLTSRRGLKVIVTPTQKPA
jgi:L-iditol 2-dehydrogenase